MSVIKYNNEVQIQLDIEIGTFQTCQNKYLRILMKISIILSFNTLNKTIRIITFFSYLSAKNLNIKFKKINIYLGGNTIFGIQWNII